MRTYLLTGFIALLLGLGMGFFIGWIQFPGEYNESHMCQLAEHYQESYTLMVARGYRQEGDAEAARDRLQPLVEDNVNACNEVRDEEYTDTASWVEAVARRFRDRGAPPIDVEDLERLANALRQLT